jgi:hypothetical protein
MFNWLKQATPPRICEANPGKHLKVTASFANGIKTWEEKADILLSMIEVLKAGGHSYEPRKTWIELDGGFLIQPGLVSFKPLQERGVQTVTTVEVSNPAGIPSAVFEFQHSTGDTVQESIGKGFEQWMQADLPVFMDALREKPRQCTYLEIEPGARSSFLSGKRRVVLGPVSHLVARPAENKEEEHPFCPCCLFTNSGDIWKDKISDSAFYGIRLFAMRDSDGSTSADCRVNGLDWDIGTAALTQYARSWPDRGVEFRKQYIVIQNAQNDRV